MKKYNLSQIMSVAWWIFRKGIQSFAQALRMAWANAKPRPQPASPRRPTPGPAGVIGAMR